MGDSLKNPEIMQIHDKGYKELYANKEVLMDLLHNDYITSMVFLLDQRTDIKAMIKRVNEIRLGFKSIYEGKNRQIISDWVDKTFYPDLAETSVKILNAEQGRKEGMRDGTHEGEKKKVLEIIREMGRKGMDVGLIADVVKMPLEYVRRILQ